MNSGDGRTGRRRKAEADPKALAALQHNAGYARRGRRRGDVPLRANAIIGFAGGVATIGIVAMVLSVTAASRSTGGGPAGLIVIGAIFFVIGAAGVAWGVRLARRHIRTRAMRPAGYKGDD